jgi:hypothetical protein
MSADKPDSSRYRRNENSPAGNRVGCASSQTIVENTTVSPSGEPSSDDCYTTTPHNRNHDQGLSVSERSGKRAGGVYTQVVVSCARRHIINGGQSARVINEKRATVALRLTSARPQTICGTSEQWQSHVHRSPVTKSKKT